MEKPLPSTGQEAAAKTLIGKSGLKPRSLWIDAFRRFRHHRLAVVGAVVLLIITLLEIFGPMVIPYEPTRIDIRSRNQPPSLLHPFGTDELGRDQLIRTLYGGRISLTVSLLVVTFAATIGLTIGAIAGYFGGVIDNILMRLVDVVMSMPGLFLTILIVSLLGASFWTVVLSLSILSWAGTSRLVRGQILSLKEREFIEAARSLGIRDRRIIIHHLLPNAISPVIVSATLGVGGAILTESALSFLGLGFQPPNASWGGLLQASQSPVLHQGYWWMAFFPGLMIFLTVLSVNYIGDALRDALDPRWIEK